MKRMLDGAPAILAMVLLTNPAAVLGSVAPAVVYDFTEGFHFLPRQASTLMSVELAGITVAVALASLLVGRFERHLLAVVAIFIATTGQFVVLVTQVFYLVLIARVAVGFRAGIAYSVGISALAGTRQPERNFGLAMASNTIDSTLILMLVAVLHITVDRERGFQRNVNAYSKRT